MSKVLIITIVILLGGCGAQYSESGTIDLPFLPMILIDAEAVVSTGAEQ